jgi:DNA adenine methylase
LVPPIKCHGGKGAHGGKLAKWIVSLMPPHKHYVEPFAGGLAVLLHKHPNGVSEVVNDLNGNLTNFWRVVQDPAAFARFVRIVPRHVEEAQWNDAEARLNDSEPAERAAAYFIRCRQSLAGRMDAFTPLSRTRTRGGMNGEVSAWQSAIEGLPAVHERLQRVVIVGPKCALEVIRQQDGPQTLFYCDPPYLHETRTAADVYGECEMSDQQHRDLLSVLRTVQGKVLLSGYRSDVYDTLLADWQRHEFDTANHAAHGASKRRMTECVWTNFC